jgi:hypothetical protein
MPLTKLRRWLSVLGAAKMRTSQRMQFAATCFFHRQRKVSDGPKLAGENSVPPWKR